MPARFRQYRAQQFRGPGYFDIDAQVTKNFTLKEKYKFGFGDAVLQPPESPELRQSERQRDFGSASA